MEIVIPARHSDQSWVTPSSPRWHRPSPGGIPAFAISHASAARAIAGVPIAGNKVRQ